MTAPPVAARRSWFWPLLIGALITAGVIAVTVAERLPLAMIRVLRPRTAPLDLRGGARLVFRADPEIAKQMDEAAWSKLAATLRSRGNSLGADVRVRRQGDDLVVDFDGATPESVDRFQGLTRPALLQFKMVEDGSTLMLRLAQHVNQDPEARALGITASGDAWAHEESGIQYTDTYLRAEDRRTIGPDGIERTIGADATIRKYLVSLVGSDPSLMPDDAHEILFERIEGGARYPYDGERPTVSWARSYYVQREAFLDSSHLADAEVTWDPMVNRPEVLVTFTSEGRRRFADATTRYAGHKLAILLDGRVRSAPVIMGPITGGRSTITMGGGDPDQVRRDAQDLANALRSGALSTPLVLMSEAYVPRTLSKGRVLIYGAIWALLLGLAATFASRAAQRIPIPPFFRRSPTPDPTPIPTPAPTPDPAARASESLALWLRLTVTGAAILVVNLADRVHLPYVNYVELRNYAAGPLARPDASVFALGVMPILLAFVLVELVVLAVPQWRPLRNGGPKGRARLGEPIAVIAILLAAWQGWTMARWLQSIGRGGPFLGGEVLDPGLGPTLLVAVSLVGGMLVLALLAGAVSRWGLVNGYSLLLVAPLVGRPVTYVLGLFNAGSGQHAGFVGMMGLHDTPTLFQRSLELGVYACVAVVTVWCLRRRARIEGGRALRLPAAGLVPLDVGATVIALTSLATMLGAGLRSDPPSWLIPIGFQSYAAHALLIAFLAAGFTVLFALPLPSSGEAARRTGPALAFAAVTAAGFVLALDFAYRFAQRLPHFFFTPVEIAVATAVVADGISEWIARRRLGPLVDVWPLHQVHDADTAAAALAAAGIPCHLRATGHRSLLHFFGPYVPVSILVPVERAEAAIEVLRGSLTSWRPKQS
jgi:preprotein translocase subunit SecD